MSNRYFFVDWEQWDPYEKCWQHCCSWANGPEHADGIAAIYSGQRGIRNVSVRWEDREGVTL